ncbi:response regulator [Rheinheimera baltica]|uniref:response regulator n=1 Tax=Rheinheimera baltica TaxID=67576 RepID=UPI0003FD2572|nr:response regulator [Rheinheimera baltica]MDP5190536.1 response regulator [Rheinheimera baltica]
MLEPKILLVDDVDYSRQLLRNNIIALANEKLLHHNTFIFFNANCASSAQALFDLHQPDIVFLDIDLPDGSGIDVLKKFKISHPQCFIAMVSGESTLVNVKQCIEAGAATFIAKPFTGDKIQAALRLFEKRLKQNVNSLNTH